MPKTTDINSGLTAAILRDIVRYDPAVGKFYWLRSNNQSAVVGGEAGTVEPKTGYVRFTVLGRKYQAHRLAWLYIHGRWPQHEIDHKNLNKADNRLSNLREAAPANNAANKGASKRSVLQIKGVSENRPGRFVARIGHENRVLHLGIFDTPEQAQLAYAAKASELHGKFARIE